MAGEHDENTTARLLLQLKNRAAMGSERAAQGGISVAWCRL
jgi:hypothetical protein